MKKFLWVVFLVSGFASAQELDSTSVDTLEIEPPAHYLGGYINGGISYEASPQKNNYLGIIGIGMQYDRWTIGLNHYEFLGTIQSQVVFPSIFELRYRYSGLKLEYQFYELNKLDFFVGVSYSRGVMVWFNTADDEEVLRDNFDLMKLGLRIELAKLRYVKPYINLGYQRMDGLDITLVENNNFSGLFVAVGIRIGYFNQ